jgi:hypothetical protein
MFQTMQIAIALVFYHNRQAKKQHAKVAQTRVNAQVEPFK